MTRWSARTMSPARLAMLLGLLFVALAAPTAVLLVQTQRQIRFEIQREGKNALHSISAR